MLRQNEILSVLEMLRNEHLDLRTVLTRWLDVKKRKRDEGEGAELAGRAREPNHPLADQRLPDQPEVARLAD